VTGFGPTLVALPNGSARAELPVCLTCLGEIGADWSAWQIYEGRIVPKFGPSNISEGCSFRFEAQSCAPIGLTPFAPAAKGYEKAIGTVHLGKGALPTHEFVFRDGDPVRDVVSIQGNTYHCECGAETPSDHAGTCKAPFWIREASLATWCEWRRSGNVAAAEKACHEARIGAGTVALLAWACRLWAASPEGKRAAQERALVALVNAVPEGLDPGGWRAAVLACHESCARLKNYAPHPEEWGVLAAVRGCPTGREGTWKRAAEDAAAAAYRRAIAPAAPVPRVRATWKTRGPVLAVDDGRDE
jgi:hypothetical protein